MKKNLSITSTIAALTLFSGCAKTMQLDDPALYDQYLTRSYNQPVGKRFYAVQAAFAEKGVELTKVDTERGRIVTERYVVAYVASYGYNTGSVSSLSNRYYFDVTGDKKKVFEGDIKLKLNIAASGDVTSVSVESTTTGEAQFDEMIRMTVSTWNFGRIAKGDFTVTIPYGFGKVKQED